jgi:hypothetical protein
MRRNKMSVLNIGFMPSLGQLSGTVGADSLISQINAELGNSSFFGSIDDIINKGREMFISNRIEPYRIIGNTIKNIVGVFQNEDKIIPITDEDRLRAIPSSMHLPILQYAPIRKLFDEGRIFGFGHTLIPNGDVYGRLIRNGWIPDVLEVISDSGEFDVEWCFKSTDPDLSDEELSSIRKTREYLDYILENTQGDPTDWDNDRG